MVHGNGNIVDWDAVRQRLAATERMLADGIAPPPDVQARILAERALLLAREPSPEAGEQKIEILEFSIANERYAFETDCVHEVVALRDLAPLPCVPSFVAGIANVRGRVVSIVDIRRFFDLPSRGISDSHRIILLRDGSMEFGVLADVVEGVSLLKQESLREKAASPYLTGIPEEYVKCLLSEHGVLLNARKLLHDPRIVVDEQVSP